jgi:hypothetical protein
MNSNPSVGMDTSTNMMTSDILANFLILLPLVNEQIEYKNSDNS